MKIPGLSKVSTTVRGVLGINARNIECVYQYNTRGLFPNVDDKLRCKELLDKADIPVPETYHIVDDRFSLKLWEQKLSGRDEFVVKPNRSFGGRGILLVRRDENEFVISGQRQTSDDITFHVQQIVNGAFALDNISDRAYFEEKVTNHRELASLVGESTGGVADLRIIFQFDEPIMAMLRIPTIASDGKANLHQGGVGIGLDLDTGMTKNGCHGNKVISKHPDTGEPLSGKRVPFFEKMLADGSRICDAVGLGYVGVDFVCDDRRGPLVLEVNARPGLNIQIANQQGLRERLSKCSG